MDFVCTATALSKQECVAILKMMNEFAESASTDQMHCCKTIVSQFARLDVWSKHDDLLQLMRQKIDGILCEACINRNLTP
eukprot:3111232-Amphidinium_carterae.6